MTHWSQDGVMFLQYDGLALFGRQRGIIQNFSNFIFKLFQPPHHILINLPKRAQPEFIPEQRDPTQLAD